MKTVASYASVRAAGAKEFFAPGRAVTTNHIDLPTGTVESDAGETRFNISKLNGTYEPGQIRAECTKRRVAALIGVNADNQKNRRACKRTDHKLGEYESA